MQKQILDTSLLARTIPPRTASRYCGQYEGTLDPQRILEIFSDSHKLALSSKNPETAVTRFELAIEAYHQAVSMPIDEASRASLHRAMENLAESFPEQVIVNEAVGLAEKAAKLKTPRKRLELLSRAIAVVQGGLQKIPASTVLKELQGKLRVEAERYSQD